MSLNKERLAKVEDSEMELIFRVARIALEIDNGKGNYERVLGVSVSDIDSLYVVLEETINDKEVHE